MTVRAEDAIHLIQQALQSIPTPYGENITEDVFLEIERNDGLFRQYTLLDPGRATINTMIGKYVPQVTGLQSGEQTKARRSNLIKTYTKVRVS